jgi:hypothetical protein
MDWITTGRIEELQVEAMGEETMKEYILTDEEVQEALVFLDHIKLHTEEGNETIQDPTRHFLLPINDKAKDI